MKKLSQISQTSQPAKHFKTVEEDYECTICNDRGFVPDENGKFEGYCSCIKIKKAKNYLKQSNLEHVVKKYTFETYTTEQEWQKEYKQRAMKFVNAPQGWFAYLGSTGIGKTHLMSAITIHLIGKGKQALYVKWHEEMSKCKNDYWNMDEGLLKMMETVEVLYIDDFFKFTDDKAIHPEENRLAFRIIDARYNKTNLVTIISSEKTVEELGYINGALAGRIVEMCGGMKSTNLINAPKRNNDNYRLR